MQKNRWSNKFSHRYSIEKKKRQSVWNNKLSHRYSIEKKKQSVWIITIKNREKKEPVCLNNNNNQLKLSNGKNKKRSDNGVWTEEDGEIGILEKQVLR